MYSRSELITSTGNPERFDCVECVQRTDDKESMGKQKSLDLEHVAVPVNRTHFFQPLDLTVNGSAKKSF